MSSPCALVRRLRDYVALARPRMAVLVIATVATGAWLGGRGAVPVGVLLHAMLGTALLAGGASALNQLLERDTDALMQRTRDRPLPRGRLSPREALAVGLALSGAGAAELALFTTPLAAALGLAAHLVYVLAYTPLKRVTSLNTLVGAIPGAAPPLIGWAAARGTIDPGALALFAIVFLWQFPHFFAIAWLFREDYARAGLQMLPAIEEAGTPITRRRATGYALALIPVSLAPALAGEAGTVYFLGAALLGAAFAGFALAFALASNNRAGARHLLLASLVYLPVLFGLMVLDRTATA